MDEARGEAQEGAWFSGLADELARAILDAKACTAACEELLQGSSELAEAVQQQRLLAALAAPAAICGILIDLVDRPPEIGLAAVRLCRDTSLRGAEQLEALAPPFGWAAAAAALARAAGSCERLLGAADEL